MTPFNTPKMFLLDYALGKHSELAVADSHRLLYPKNSVSTSGQGGETLEWEQSFSFFENLYHGRTHKTERARYSRGESRAPQGERKERLLCFHIAIVKLFDSLCQ